MDTNINVKVTETKMVSFTNAATNDHVLIDKLKMGSNTIYVFDTRYNDYKTFEKSCTHHTGFATHIKDNAVYECAEKQEIEEHIHFDVGEDKIIVLTVKDEN